MCACLSLLRLAESAISSPRMVLLCASHLTICDMSGELFSRQYNERRLFISSAITLSVRREGSRHQIEDLGGMSANSMDMDIGWWSDKYMESMVAAVSSGRSLCVRNR